jgi:hypothetical protein
MSGALSAKKEVNAMSHFHDDKARRHERALNLFRAEAREQELAGKALRETAAELTPGSLPMPPAAATLESLGALHLLETAAEADILAALAQLRRAGARAAQLAADDPELAGLYARIYGVGEEGSLIESEATRLPD